MKRKLLIWLTLVTAVGISTSLAESPQVSIVDKDNNKTSVPRDAISKIDISEGEVIVLKKNGEEIAFNKALVSKVLLSEGLSGIVEITNPDLKVYPYSTRDIIHVEGAREGETYYLVDINARVLQSGICGKDMMDISIANRSKGIYLLLIGNNTYKIVKL